MSYNDVNENYTDIFIQDTYQNVIHISPTSGSLFDGLGNLVSIPASNVPTASTAVKSFFADQAHVAMNAFTALTASQAISSSVSVKSFFADQAHVAMNAFNAKSASIAETASYFSGSISNAVFSETSSYAVTASYVLNGNSNIDTSSLINQNQTSSMSVLNAETASYIQSSNIYGIIPSASYSETSSYALNVETIDTSSLINQNQTSSMSVLNAETASYIDYSNIDNTPNVYISQSGQNVHFGELTADLIVANEFLITEVTRSILYQSGSTKFGDTLDDTHQITGSVLITGSSITFNGNQVATLNDIVPTVLTTLIDNDSLNPTLYYYVGKAEVGSLSSDSVWRISRITKSGTQRIVQYADSNTNFDNIYDNRESLSYS